MNILEWLNGLKRRYHIVIGLLVTAAIGYFDYATGYELRMELFYLVPISQVTWFVGQRTGILFSFLSIVTIACSDILAGKKYAHFTTELWNGAMYFVFYLVVILLLKLRKTMQQRESLIEELDETLKQNEELSAMLPVCSNCKSFRDDPEYRQQVESYMSRHVRPEFSRSLCKACSGRR